MGDMIVLGLFVFLLLLPYGWVLTRVCANAWFGAKRDFQLSLLKELEK